MASTSSYKGLVPGRRFHCKKMIDGDTIMCISNDTDFSFLGNRNILQLSSYKVRGGLIDLGISTHHGDPFDRISQNIIDREYITSIVKKYPIVDHIPNSHCMTRAACAVILGNDANPGGIKGVGPSIVAITINNFHKNKSEALIENDILIQLYNL